MFAGAIGNAMEWYDFACYAYMAPFLAKLFFPADDALASLFAAYGAFAAGYLARPIGGLLFGYLGDRVGRRTLLLVSVSMMGAATVAIGLLPTYDSIGPAAAVILIALRVVQGISVGGEYTGSLTFVAEHAPVGRRGLHTSWILVGAALGFLMGSGVATILANALSETALAQWGWRVPFLLGAMIAFVALALRRGVAEPPKPPDAKQLDRSPLFHAFRDHWRDMVRVAGLALGVNVGFYLMFVYAVSYLTDVMHVSVAKAMDINTVCMAVLCILPPVFGYLSDKIGRKPLLLGGLVAMILLSWPLFWLMHSQATLPILLGQLGFAVLFSVVYGPSPAAQVELLAHSTRVSVLSFSYNLCMSIFGGTAPLVATYLVQRTADDFAPVYYLIAMSAISLVAVIGIRERAGKPLRS